MKKLLALLLALVMVIGMVACGAKEEAAAPAATEAAPAAPAATEADPDASSDKPYDGATVTWWHYPYTGEDQGYWDERAAVFYEQTGITVETTIIPWGADGAAKLSAGFLGGTGPGAHAVAEQHIVVVPGPGKPAAPVPVLLPVAPAGYHHLRRKPGQTEIRLCPQPL